MNRIQQNRDISQSSINNVDLQDDYHSESNRQSYQQEEQTNGYQNDQETYRSPVIKTIITDQDRPTYKIWFTFLIAGMIILYMLCFKIFGIPNLSVPCILDRGHEVTEPFNRFVNQNVTYGHGVVLLSSLCIDFVVISSLVYWFFHARSLRIGMAILMFYTIRLPHLYVYVPKYPEGFFFEYPGFPSITVPYGRTSDFFFSGHCGIMTLCFLEWRTVGSKRMMYLNGVLLVYLIFALITLRVHYTADITTGIIVAHYIYIIAQTIEDRANQKAHQLQDWLQATGNKLFKKQKSG